jgi:hypothetical protein
MADEPKISRSSNIELMFDATTVMDNNSSGQHKLELMFYETAQSIPVSVSGASGYWLESKFRSKVVKVLSIQWPVAINNYQFRFQHMLKLAKRISSEFNEPVVLQALENYEIREGEVV